MFFRLFFYTILCKLHGIEFILNYQFFLDVKWSRISQAESMQSMTANSRVAVKKRLNDMICAVPVRTMRDFHVSHLKLSQSLPLRIP